MRPCHVWTSMNECFALRHACRCRELQINSINRDSHANVSSNPHLTMRQSSPVLHSISFLRHFHVSASFNAQ